MKILLISTSREMMPFPVAPIGLAYIAGTLRANGFIIKFLDLCFVEDIEKEIVHCLKEFNPKFIGISVRNLDNSTFINAKSYIEEVKTIINHIKRLSKSEIMIGGAGFSSCPEEILRYLGLKIGIVGEGEESFLEFLKKFQKGEDIHSIPGLVYEKDNQYIVNKRKVFSSMDELPKPAWDLIDFTGYLKYGGYGAVQTKRGCAFNCIYCCYPVIEGNRYRLRSPVKIVDEIEVLKRDYGINYFYFVDSVFSFPESHAEEICKEINRRKLKIKWSAMTNPLGINEKLVNLMKASGCIGVEVGIDSASEVMLKNLKKRFKKKDIAHTAELYTKAGIPFLFCILLGGPGETIETIKETVDFLKTIEKSNQILFNLGIRIYKGTKLEKIARNEKIIHQNEDLLMPVCYLSDKMSMNNLKDIDRFCISELTWSSAEDWYRPMNILLQKMAQRLQFRPLWKHAYILGVIRKLRVILPKTII